MSLQTLLVLVWLIVSTFCTISYIWDKLKKIATRNKPKPIPIPNEQPEPKPMIIEQAVPLHANDE